MNNTFKTVLGLMIPFLGTSAGALPVLFMNRDFGPRLKKFLFGFAAGVMIAASVWSLLIPAIEMTGGRLAFLPAVSGFLTGIALLAVFDTLIDRLCRVSSESLKTPHGVLMTAIAVTLHNIPEGMAVGVAFAGIRGGAISFPEALALAIGISVQNLPEGAIVSLPLRAAGLSRGKALLYGILSGAVEPVGAAVTVILTAAIAPVLPFILSFAAGAMMYVVANELIPEAQCPERSMFAVSGLSLGFSLMMLLDVTLG